jgi:hypothetical protein
LTEEEIARALGLARTTVQRWKRDSAFKRRLGELRAELREEMGRNTIADQLERLQEADDVRFYREGKYGSYEFLSIYSRHSNASGLDGHNIVAFAGDEVDAFERTETVCRATLIHDIFRSSASTRVKRGWIGAMFSYPRTEDGFMMKLYERAINDMREFGPKATYFADRAATWEVRPDISRDTPTIADDYKNDPKGAMARYECLPMAADDGFFEFDEYVVESVNLAKRPVARWREVMGTLETAKGTKSCVRVEVVDITPEPGRNYFMGGDGSLSGDAFAISIWSTPAEREWKKYYFPGRISSSIAVAATVATRLLPSATPEAWSPPPSRPRLPRAHPVAGRYCPLHFHVCLPLSVPFR